MDFGIVSQDLEYLLLLGNSYFKELLHFQSWFIANVFILIKWF